MALAVLLALLGSWVGVFTILRSFLPPDLFTVLDTYKSAIFRRWSFFSEFQVPEHSGAGNNDLYKAVHHYISSLSLVADAECLVVECPKDTKTLMYEVAADKSASVTDVYKGVKMKWCRVATEKENRFFNYTDNSYELVVAKQARHLVPEYFNFVLERGKKIESQGRFKKLYANLDMDYWSSVAFDPPATFETVAMEPGIKELLMDDLTKFLNGKEYYNKVGRAWKRGYLLYGPPGSGKSSLIGAIANFTGYDVYDLELSKVRSNSMLKQLLINVDSRSIVVVEDIDCSIQFHNRQLQEKEGEEERNKAKKKQEEEGDGGLTLSGLLNVTDGLWSGSERIFVFTTNYVEKLDAALLRPGRMDMHICMSYCSYPVFKILARNYLTVEDHQLFPRIEELLNKAKITPAAVVETLLRHDSDAGVALQQLVVTLQEKAAENNLESQVSISLQGEDGVSDSQSDSNILNL